MELLQEISTYSIVTAKGIILYILQSLIAQIIAILLIYPVNVIVIVGTMLLVIYKLMSWLFIKKRFKCKYQLMKSKGVTTDDIKALKKDIRELQQIVTNYQKHEQSQVREKNEVSNTYHSEVQSQLEEILKGAKERENFHLKVKQELILSIKDVQKAIQKILM